MKISRAFPRHRENVAAIVLTIGNFDGVHVGHQVILSRIKEVAKARQTTCAIITFANHPSTVLRPEHPTPLLCSAEHKIRLLDEAGVDQLFLIPFTKEFSQQPADLFLRNIQRTLPFALLVLGSDATIGKNREGDRSLVLALAKTEGFEVEYLSDSLKDGTRVSSSGIRTLIQQGNFSQAAKFLGRPYSIYAPVIKGHNRGASIGYPTANIAVEGLCLPPLGVYAVTLHHRGQCHLGIANLGVAPTVRQAASPILEVHLFNADIDLYGECVDVCFLGYIRPEQRFQSLDLLKDQIAADIIKAKQIHADST